MSHEDQLSKRIEELTIEILKELGPMDFQDLIDYLLEKTTNGKIPDTIAEDTLSRMGKEYKIKFEEVDSILIVSLDRFN